MIFEAEVFEVKNPSPGDLADSLVPPAPEPPPGDPSGLTQLQVFETWGWILSRRTGLFTLGFDDRQLDRVLHGLAAGVRGEPPPCALDKIGPVVEQYAGNRRKQAAIALKQKRLADSAAFFARLKKNPHVAALPDGLCYEIITPGAGAVLKPGQIARVEYTGRLLSTDSEFDHTEGPADLAFGGGVLGTGWDEGMQKIRKGGRIKIYVPPALGYGDEDITGVPADSTLIFDVTLLDIKDAPPDAAPPNPSPK
jgi:FKBP-type peptidyl-prolyl cis-trans isomerase